MESVKLLLLVCVAVVSAKHHFSKEILDEFEQFLDEKKDERELLNTDVQKKDTIAPTEDVDGNGNRDTCDAMNIKCHHCTKCWPAGWCVTNKSTEPNCLCKHGWNGTNAVYVTTQSLQYVPEGRNRIFANDCNTPCHYTHDYRNIQCAAECTTGNCQSDPIPCKTDCSPKSHGTCLNLGNGKQQCCRGWSGDDGAYDVQLGAYVATCCNKKCHYLGKGITNDQCDKTPVEINDCDPKCLSNGGKCNSDTGKCECCLGWTGPNAELQADGSMHADYCDVYCPYPISAPNKKCANPNYVKRLRDEPTRVYHIA